MERLNKFPRGYLVRVAESIGDGGFSGVDIADCTHDPEIETLYKLYMGHSAVNPEKWEFRRRVIVRCSQLFGDFNRWLALQACYNDNMYGLNLDFLVDTVQYIRTGQRETSVQIWQELLAEYPETHPGIATSRRMEMFKLTAHNEFDSFISQWCSHRGGLEDMLCTARTLFGVAKSPLLSHPL